MNKPRGRLSSEAKIEVELIRSGRNGKDGLSAYELWLEAGNEGTLDDFLASHNDYNLAVNKPKINGVELIGDFTIETIDDIISITNEEIESLFVKEGSQ